MNKLLRILKALRYYLKLSVWSQCDSVEWTAADGLYWESTLDSVTGRKVRMLLHEAVGNVNSDAVHRGDVGSCGYARGYASAVADVLSLSAGVVPETTQTEDSSKELEEELERFAP